jgi:Fe-S oxidoreductase
MKQHAGIKVANELMGVPVALTDRCCGESGTLAIARPDVATQVRFRKQEEIEHDTARLRASNAASASATTRILTSCPSCLQGLARYAHDAGGVESDYLVIELARHVLGERWLEEYIDQASHGGIERVLL